MCSHEDFCDCSYCGRLSFELVCEESSTTRTQIVDIPTSMLLLADTRYRLDHYTLFCTFFAANLVHPDFK